MERLVANWMYGGALAGVLLLAIAPVVVGGWPTALAMCYLLLPIYMLHQYEEHDRDRFRLFFNETLGHGRELLSPLAVFIVNVPGVWGIIAVSLTLAATVNTGFALIAAYLVLINALVHILQAARMRAYNPGLVTGIVFFLPAGGYALLAVQRAGAGSLGMHALGLIVAVGVHLLILLYVKRRMV